MIDLSLRDRIYQVIFGTDTVAGQRVDQQLCQYQR